MGKNNIILRLIGDSSKFSAAMNRAQSMTRKFSKGIRRSVGPAARDLKKLGRIATSLPGMFLGLAGAASAVQGLKEAFEGVDNLAKKASSLGITTESLQSMELAAGLAGSNLNDLEKSLFRMTKNVSDAAQGIGVAQRSLKDLGLDAGKLRDLQIDEQMLVIADAFQGVENKTDRTRIAMDLFGRSGKDLINLLAGGSGAFKSAAKDIEDMGVGISRIDASKVETANDEFLRFRTLARAAFQVLAVELAPAVAGFSNRMVDAGKNSKGVKGIISDLVGSAVKGFDLANTGIQAFKTGWIAIQFAVKGSLAATTGYFASFLKGMEGVYDSINKLKGVIPDSVKTAISSMSSGPARTPVGLLLRKLNGFIGGEGFDTSGLKKSRRFMEDFSKFAKEDADKLFMQLENSAGRTSSAYAGELSKKLKKLKEEFDVRHNLKENNRPEINPLGSTEDPKDPVGKFRKGMKKMEGAAKESFDKMDQSRQRWMGSFTSAMTNMVMTGKLQFKDLTNSILSDMASMAIQRNITEPLFNAIFPKASDSKSKTSDSNASPSLSRVAGPTPSIQIVNQSPQPLEVSRVQQSNEGGIRKFKVFVRNTVRKGLADRSFDTVLNQGFGLTRQGT
jgi:hypothetical protein